MRAALELATQLAAGDRTAKPALRP
jgi:hypothetical protein